MGVGDDVYVLIYKLQTNGNVVRDNTKALLILMLLCFLFL